MKFYLAMMILYLIGSFAQNLDEIKKCYMDDQEQRCTLDEMNDEMTLVYPAAPTRCVFDSVDGTGSNLSFFHVQPGDSVKLLLHFPGGGGCFFPWQCTQGVGFKTVPTLALEGIFNKSRLENPFHSWTIVLFRIVPEIFMSDRGFSNQKMNPARWHWMGTTMFELFCPGYNQLLGCIESCDRRVFSWIN